MDLQYDHQTVIYALEACHTEDGKDLIAVGGERSVEVFAVTDTACIPVVSFNIGSRVTALAWSPRTSSPSVSDSWNIELVAADMDLRLWHLRQQPDLPEDKLSFGGGLTGHRDKIVGISFAGGRDSDESERYVGTISADDRQLMVWDLEARVDAPVQEMESTSASPPAAARNPSFMSYSFQHPLVSIQSHTGTSKIFLVADCRGTIFLVDWLEIMDGPQPYQPGGPDTLQLYDPHALAESSRGRGGQFTGSVAWHKNNQNEVAAVYGSRFSLWDTNCVRGGKPSASGNTFVDGGNRIRWCPTMDEYFAISSQSPSKGAIVEIHDSRYHGTQPHTICVKPRPHIIRDFDFISLPGLSPRIAVAVGRSVIIFPMGESDPEQ
ncbi:hypothetical protein CYLTODRAFT_380628 [Cylindrobasidium torrendii FP15055 ss-10]|uniref:WD40 repeat-like protein n=1 Tax=Cylindrobasidium torrendii FP15055 ss-10 TaxID=1314674 RepID=A0A0D7B305_9AGAR|nr:hypothetical protein CYLTODRAFT_380628 [Cylindrobasidium torrendii FP15055 ss-10]